MLVALLVVKVIPAFITGEEERIILSLNRPTNVKLGVGRNTITRYGSILPYKASLKSKSIPPILQSLCERIHSQHITTDIPDSVTINEYLPEQSIDWHKDSLTSGPIIVVLSLLSSATMGLRKGTEKQEIILPPMSLLIMSGEHRYDWEHCIYPVQFRRYSVVFRKGTT